MHKITILAILVVCICALFEVTQGQEAMLAPPIRPSSFRTPDQLRRYLQALNDYYAIVGRPRFGRSVDQASLTKRLLQSADSVDEGFEDSEDTYGYFA